MSDPSIFSDKRNQFAYFDAQLGHPDWSRARVLDFGGNRGNLLESAAGAIDPTRYWCLDVSKEALDAGARRFPDAHFVHYNRRHFGYNPGGRRNEPLPRLNERFDYILAFSVFTMLDEQEIVEHVAALRPLLADGGVLAFTFIDPSHRQLRKGRVVTNLEWRLDVAAESGVLIDPATRAIALSQTTSCYLIAQRWIEPAPRLTFETFLSVEHVQRLFPGCGVGGPTEKVRHHCCVIGG